MLRRLRTVAYWLVCALLVVAVVAAATLIVTIRRSFPQTSGELDVRGLHAPVRVDRDARGVPQLYARGAHDLMYAQGFVHAQDRFWQMDAGRHLGAGRLAELFGRSQVETDKYLRTMGWRRVAKREYAMLSQRTRDALKAYADGVNAYLRDRSGSELSFEYALLRLTAPDYEPRRWTPVDSLTWLKVMAWQLRGNDQAEQTRSLLATRLPVKRVEQLYPPYPYDKHRPIVRGGTVEHGTFRPPSASSTVHPDRVPPSGMLRKALRSAGARSALTRAGAALRTVSAVAGAGGQGIGSNSWAVAGSRTASGKPIIANDPHLGPALPSIWYQMGLHCAPVRAGCPYDVAGFTFAGTPGVVIGHDARVAWGFTNLGPDVSDLYLEKVKGDRYKYRGRWRPLAKRTETIRVAGGDPVTITVRATRHGPLLSDVSDDLHAVGKHAVPRGRAGSAPGPYAVALRWTALIPGHTADAIFVLDTASNFSDLRHAARLFDVPAQNLVYADVDGHIGYQAPGKIPIRRGYDGRWPAVGWTGEDEWDGFIPFRALPHVLDPEEGYVVTANQAAAPRSYPYLLTKDWDYGYRSQRITHLIKSADDPVTVASTSRMQLDTYNPMAAKLVPYLLKARPPAGAKKARDLLRGWDFRTPPDSAAAAYWNAVWAHLLVDTFGDELPAAARPDGGSRWFDIVSGLLATPRSTWWDDQRTARVVETRNDMLTAAMGEADEELRETLGPDPAKWRWGELHTLTVRNQSFGTSGIGVVERLVNRGPLHVGGGSSVVDATGWTAGHGYQVDWVPSMRMVVDLADLDRSTWVNLTGASGHTFHRHYFDQARPWARGRTTPMRWGRDAIADATEDRLVLRPAGS